MPTIAISCLKARVGNRITDLREDEYLLYSSAPQVVEFQPQHPNPGGTVDITSAV
jgi:hypothetical protein